jgi:hypothetical protein
VLDHKGVAHLVRIAGLVGTANASHCKTVAGSSLAYGSAKDNNFAGAVPNPDATTSHFQAEATSYHVVMVSEQPVRLVCLLMAT